MYVLNLVLFLLFQVLSADLSSFSVRSVAECEQGFMVSAGYCGMYDVCISFQLKSTRKSITCI